VSFYGSTCFHVACADKGELLRDSQFGIRQSDVRHENRKRAKIVGFDVACARRGDPDRGKSAPASLS